MEIITRYRLKEYYDYAVDKLKAESAISYIRVLNYCIEYLGEEMTYNATVKDIHQYLEHLRNKKIKGSVISRYVASLKFFYQYLIFKGQRKNNPCSRIRIKDYKNADIQLQDLFESEELEKLLHRKERFTAWVGLRNKVIVSLLIYQGLTVEELIQLNLKNIDIEKGTLYAQGTSTTNARTLPLHSSQIMLLYRYLNENRPKLVAERLATESLILNTRGKRLTYEDIQYLLQTYQNHIKNPLKPYRKLSSRSIRQSVIANLLKDGKDTRWVQVFAGHKLLKTTVSYKEENANELQSIIEKYHPLT